MEDPTGEQQVIQWLQGNLKQKESKLDGLEVQIQNLLAVKEKLQAEIGYLRGTLQIAQSDINVSKTNIPEVTACQTENQLTSINERGTPEDWLHQDYKILGSRDAAAEVLAEQQEAIDVDALVKTLYDTKDEEEFRRAKNSLSSTLRRGAEAGMWEKVGRTFYQAKSINPNVETESLFTKKQTISDHPLETLPLEDLGQADLEKISEEEDYEKD